MSQARPFDPNIPVLTELFSDQDDAPAGAPEEAAPPVQDEAGAEQEARALAGWSEPEWNVLERRLSERILLQVQGRVDFVLEQRLRDSMEQVLDQAVAELSARLRQSLQQTIETIVVRAVAEELAHLQTLKN